MPRIAEDHARIVEDKNDEHYLLVRGEDHLHCATCGKEVVMLRCKCGKYGPRSYMDAHLANRKAREHTAAGLSAHGLMDKTKVLELVRTPEPPPPVLTPEEPSRGRGVAISTSPHRAFLPLPKEPESEFEVIHGGRRKRHKMEG